MAAGDQQQAAQRRAVEGPSGAPEALTTLSLEVDTEYYEALSEDRGFDWERAARARTATRVSWADGVMSPTQRLSTAHEEGTPTWNGVDTAVEELEEYSSWQISIGIANERAALTSAVRTEILQRRLARATHRTCFPPRATDSHSLCTSTRRANHPSMSSRRGSSAWVCRKRSRSRSELRATRARRLRCRVPRPRTGCARMSETSRHSTTRRPSRSAAAVEVPSTRGRPAAGPPLRARLSACRHRRASASGGAPAPAPPTWAPMGRGLSCESVRAWPSPWRRPRAFLHTEPRRHRRITCR